MLATAYTSAALNLADHAHHGTDKMAVQAMGAMNKQMNLPALSNIMREFDRQNERMEMTSEMMGDAVDDAFEVHLTLLCVDIRAALQACMTQHMSLLQLQPHKVLPTIHTFLPADCLFTSQFSCAA